MGEAYTSQQHLRQTRLVEAVARQQKDLCVLQGGPPIYL
jgi:hypothetical protein